MGFQKIELHDLLAAGEQPLQIAQPLLAVVRTSLKTAGGKIDM